MAQQIQFLCSCGWQENLLFGPTMTHPGNPVPKLCKGCGELRSGDDICPECLGELQEWDAKSCPRCGKELERRLLAFVD